mgnify:FL=1
MSWFDATGLANIAKTALKEAQKTIDKALDIRDEEEISDNVKPKLSNKGENSFEKKESKDKQEVIKYNDNEKNVESLKANKMPTSNWGSFSGSFFQIDNSKNSNDKSVLISTQPQKLSLLLSNENEKVAPLATPETELTPGDKNSQNDSPKNLISLPSELQTTSGL